MASDGICPAAVNADDWAQRLAIRGGVGGRDTREEEQTHIEREIVVVWWQPLIKLSKRFIDDQNCWIILVNKYIFCLCLLWLEQLRSAQGVMLLNTHRRLMWHFKTAGTINNSHRGGSCTHPTSQWLTCAWISFLFLTFSEQSSVSAWSLMHTGVHYTQSIAPVLLSWNTLLISSLGVDISMGETSMSVIHETTF